MDVCKYGLICLYCRISDAEWQAWGSATSQQVLSATCTLQATARAHAAGRAVARAAQVRSSPPCTLRSTHLSKEVAHVRHQILYSGACRMHAESLAVAGQPCEWVMVPLFIPVPAPPPFQHTAHTLITKKPGSGATRITLPGSRSTYSRWPGAGDP